MLNLQRLFWKHYTRSQSVTDYLPDRSCGRNSGGNSSSSYSSAGKSKFYYDYDKCIPPQVVPGESGEYDIVYSLPKEGQYRMWIRIYDKDIQDSPFQVRND
jgi:hypothetical protein